MNNAVRVFEDYLRYSLTRHLVVHARLPGLFLKSGYEHRNICRLGEVIIHLLADRFQGRLKIRIAGQDEGGSVRLETPHGDDQNEAVRWAANIEVGQQHLKWLMVDDLQRFGNRCRDRHLKSFLLKNRRKR